MSSFNNITKIKYNQNQSDPVALFEYVLCSDTDNQKVVVFKFKNNMNQVLNEIKFEVYQYDENNDLIEKIVVHHDDFKTEEAGFFIPNAKLRVLENCTSIKTVLLYARFERVSWSNNEFRELTYTKNDFRNEYSKHRVKYQKPTVKSKFLEKVELLGEKQRAEVLYRGLTRKKGFTSASTYKATISKSAFWLTVAFSIIVLLYVSISAGIFSFTSRVEFDGMFDYTILSNNEVSISDYEGQDDKVVIPTYYKEYKVVSIDEKAFKNSYITEITFTSEVTIEDKAFLNSYKLKTIVNPEMVTSIGYNAFEGCSSLESVEFVNASRVEAYAFKNCKKLKSVSLPIATLEIGTFLGCTSLERLVHDNTYQNSFKTLFNEEGTDITPSVEYVYTNRRYIDSGYFDGCSNITKIEFPTDALPMFGFGALKGTNLSSRFYECNETCEVYYGEMISFNTESTKLIIPNSITRIENTLKFIKNIANNVTDLTLEYKGSAIAFDSAFIKQFHNLEKITIAPGVTCDSNMLIGTNVNEVSLHANSKYQLSFPSSVDKLNIIGSGYLTAAWFYNIQNAITINELFIDKEVNVNSSALSSLSSVVSLKLYNSAKSLQNMGVSRTLRTLDILLDEENTTIVPSFTAGYYNLSTINIPEGITYIGSKFLENNTSITEFKLPESVEEVGLPLIGSGCTNLTTVTTKFVGSKLTNQSEYNAFNKSSNYTVRLNITGEYTDLRSKFSTNCFAMTDLTIANVNSYYKGSFSGLTSIQNITMKVKSLDSIGELFNTRNSNVNLKTLNITVDKLENKAIQGAKIDKLIISGECEISSDLLKGAEVGKIFFTNASSFGEYVDYATFFENYDGYVYIAEEFEYSALGYEERIRSNYSLDEFMSR